MLQRMHLFGIGFLYTIQNAALSFFASPFLLELGFSQSAVGILFATANIVGLALLGAFPYMLRYISTRCIFSVAGTILTASLFALAFSTHTLVSVILLLTCMLASLLLWSVFDIGLEHTTQKENETGRTRSLFLSAINIGFVAIPGIAGFLVTLGGFPTLFFLLGCTMLIATLYGSFSFPLVPSAQRQKISLNEMLDLVITQPDIRRVFSAQFLLQVFYTFMTIYMPVMLLETYGLTLQEMSFVFSLAMIAFLVVEIPVGYISDTWLGEKEIMIMGFIILTVSTLSLPLFAGASVLLWGTIMFISRVGAASVEVTTESYFFKHVHSNDTVQVSAFRMLGPLARVITPLLGATFLTFFPITYMPVLLAVFIAIVSTIELRKLRDTL